MENKKTRFPLNFSKVCRNGKYINAVMIVTLLLINQDRSEEQWL